MSPNKRFEDIAKLLEEIQKESNGINQWLEHNSENLEMDWVKCISCGKEKSESEMQKIFHKKYKGICKMCFRFEIEE
jgi:hypothetical protein